MEKNTDIDNLEGHERNKALHFAEDIIVNESNWKNILKRNREIKIEMACELMSIGFIKDIVYLILNIDNGEES